MRLRLNIFCAALGIILLLGACRKDILWSESKRLPADGWTTEHSIDFNLDPAAYEPPPANRFAEFTARSIGDTTARIIGTYHAFLSLRYRSDCNAAKIGLIVEKFGLSEPTSTDTITLTLFDASGSPTGKGRLGIYETGTPIAGEFHVKEGTILSVRPISYCDTIFGLSSLSLFLCH